MNETAVTVVQIHQLLHGYRNGHERLAGSVKLRSKDAELVARLSDLSGALQAANTFKPYLTLYPLPSGQFYAVAKTWLDLEAPRSGCVLTHTLLVPVEDWTSGAANVRDVVARLAKADRRELSKFDVPLNFRPDDGAFGRSCDVRMSQVEEFVSKYFGEGARPIVWFRDEESSDILTAIVQVLWGSLRANFAACSMSLQPRMLQSNPFDLLFAPTNVYSRFSKIARENLIESKGSKVTLTNEPWITMLSQAIVDSHPLPAPTDWPDLGMALGPEPTSVRWLYMLSELRSRATESPMAALGSMDIVETLCPNPEAKLELKSTIAGEAIAAVRRFPRDDEALNFGQLVCERLSHPSFHKVGPTVFEQLTQAIELRSQNSIEDALSSYETIRGRIRAESAAADAFKSGISHSLLLASDADEAKLLPLQKYDAVAADIVPNLPRLAERYLRASRKSNRSASRDLARWFAQSTESVNWKELAERLLPLSVDIEDQAIYSEMFAHLTQVEVQAVLESIPKRMLSRRSFLNVIEKQAAPRHPVPVRACLLPLCDDSEHAARIVGSTLEPSTASISYLLCEPQLSPHGRAAILAEIFLRDDKKQAAWILEAFENHPTLLSDMLFTALEGSERALKALSVITSVMDVISPEAINGFVDRIGVLDRVDVPPWLCAVVMRSAIIGALRGRIVAKTFDRLTALACIKDWMVNADSHWMVGVFTSGFDRYAVSPLKAWTWVAEAPEVLYRMRHAATVSLVAELCRRTSPYWSHDIERRWKEIIRRAQQFCEPRFGLRHSVQAIEFAYKNNKLPLAGVVSTAFPNVYRAVIENYSFVDEARSLVSYEWDKAKALRRNLVDAFYRSDLAPGDLALAANGSFGLRKLFKRVRRKWSGEEYIERMLRDLGARKDEEAAECRRELLGFLQKPDFYEPWD